MKIVFSVIVLDLIGFGIMIPIFAYYAMALGASPALATGLSAIYSASLFVAAPMLGRVSDYFGRKRVLLLSMAGAVIGYLLMAAADNLWWLVFSRVISGAMAGNISAAQAYISDITSVENRAKGMGLLGAAFGIGFMVGPVLGSALAGDDFNAASFVLPALVSAGLSAAAFFAILFFLPESLSEEQRAENRRAPKTSRLQAFTGLTDKHMLLVIIACALVYNVCAGLNESILPIYAAELGIIKTPQGLIPILLLSGIVLVAIQGGLIGRLTRRFGELNLLRTGTLIFAAGLMAMTLAGDAASLTMAVIAMSIQSAGSALILTSAQSLASQTALPHERGVVMGVYSSAGTMGRTIGTVLTGSLFTYWHVHSSYWVGAVLAILVLLMSYRIDSRPFTPH